MMMMMPMIMIVTTNDITDATISMNNDYGSINNDNDDIMGYIS